MENDMILFSLFCFCYIYNVSILNPLIITVGCFWYINIYKAEAKPIMMLLTFPKEKERGRKIK